MRNLVVGTFVSMDGVMQGPGWPEEDRDGGFDLGGWTVNYWDQMMGEVMDGQMSKSDGLLLGRRTYEIFAAHWPHAGDEDPTAAQLNNVRKYVATRTLDKVEWNNSTILQGDVAEAVARIKEEPGGEIHVTGSCNLIQTLLRNDLVDRFVLWIFPVVLGSGKRLFGEGAVPVGFTCVDTKVSTTGVIIATYEKAGPIELGSFALEDEESVGSVA
ncbi:MAG TPA: dihydrofolate reductase family protein [Actinomycetota bacterium]|nr:dihydrofolate reductase family protein [Actinomycetota bacterium]